MMTKIETRMVVGYNLAVLFSETENNGVFTMSSNNFLPTDTVPGSPERLEVIRQRILANQPCNHPQDKNGDQYYVMLARGLTIADMGNGKPFVVGTGEAVAQSHHEPRTIVHQPKKISAIIRLLRKKAGLSVAGLAERSGVAKRSIHFYEQGQREPGLTALVSIAQALGASLAVNGEIVAA